MHSAKEKWVYYKSVSDEIYEIITDNLDKPPYVIIKEIKIHLDNYNDKSHLYKFRILMDDNYEIDFRMKEYTNHSVKELFKKKFNLKNIIRKIKLDNLLDG